MSLLSRTWPCGLSGAVAVAAAGCREAAARLAKALCWGMAEPWGWSTRGQGRPGAWRASWRGTVAGEPGAVADRCPMAGAEELRSCRAAGRCQRAAVALHGERGVGRNPSGRLLSVALPSVMPCPPCLKGTESSARLLCSGCFQQVWREEIRGTTGASSGTPGCQEVVFDPAAVQPNVSAKRLNIKKGKKASENVAW